MSQITRWSPLTRSIIMPSVTDFRRSLRDGVTRELRRLGCRTTELVNLLGIPRATVTRALGGTRPELALSRRRQLSALEQWLVTAFWHEVAGRHGLNPPPLDQLLRSFCDVCRPTGAPHDRPARRAHALEADALAGLAVPKPPILTECGEIYRHSLLLCHRDPKPELCFTGAARFALFCAGLAASPWTVAVFLNQHVSSRGCAVRACIRCGRKFVSESRAHAQCGCGLDPNHVQPVALTRLARTELALRP